MFGMSDHQMLEEGICPHCGSMITDSKYIYLDFGEVVACEYCYCDQGFTDELRLDEYLNQMGFADIDHKIDDLKEEW